MKKIIKFLLIGCTIVSFTLLVGCNTMAGLGKDVQKGGKALQKAAQKDKNHKKS